MLTAPSHWYPVHPPAAMNRPSGEIATAPILPSLPSPSGGCRTTTRLPPAAPHHRRHEPVSRPPPREQRPFSLRGEGAPRELAPHRRLPHMPEEDRQHRRHHREHHGHPRERRGRRLLPGLGPDVVHHPGQD